MGWEFPAYGATSLKPNVGFVGYQELKIIKLEYVFYIKQTSKKKNVRKVCNTVTSTVLAKTEFIYH